MLLIALFLLQAAASAAPAPATLNLAQPLVRVTGKGDQIYTCAAQGKWTFTAPEATLYLDGKEVGTHGKGPSWTWSDGSSITGKLLSSKPAAQPAKDIPDLTLDAAGISGPKGFLSSAHHTDGNSRRRCASSRLRRRAPERDATRSLQCCVHVLAAVIRPLRCGPDHT